MRTQVDINVTATVGDTVQFNCTTENLNKTRWTRSLHGNTTAKIEVLFRGWSLNPRLSSRFNVTLSVSERLSQLTVVDIRIDDAGVYTCSRSTGDGDMISITILSVTNDSGKLLIHFVLISNVNVTFQRRDQNFDTNAENVIAPR